MASLANSALATALLCLVLLAGCACVVEPPQLNCCALTTGDEHG